MVDPSLSQECHQVTQGFFLRDAVSILDTVAGPQVGEDKGGRVAGDTSLGEGVAITVGGILTRDDICKGSRARWRG